MPGEHHRALPSKWAHPAREIRQNVDHPVRRGYDDLANPLGEHDCRGYTPGVLEPPRLLWPDEHERIRGIFRVPKS